MMKLKNILWVLECQIQNKEKKGIKDEFGTDKSRKIVEEMVCGGRFIGNGNNEKEIEKER